MLSGKGSTVRRDGIALPGQARLGTELKTGEVLA